jgi:hypothetical protein
MTADGCQVLFSGVTWLVTATWNNKHGLHMQGECVYLQSACQA